MEEGNAHFEAKHYHAAMKCYDICVAANPTRLRAYLIRAAARLAVKDYQGAISDCKSVLRIDSTKLKAWFRYAHCWI